MSEKKELQQTADAILGSAVTITVDVRPRNGLERLLQRYKLKEAKRVFHVKPLVLGSLVRISRLLLTIDNTLLTKELLDHDDQFRLLNTNYGLMQQHAASMARVIAVAVTNGKAEPPESLVTFFLYNLTPKELIQVFGVVLSQMNISSFTASIISVRGLNVLDEKAAGVNCAGMNPQTQGSEIASGN